jgi:DNA-binding MarR family transcriptional regulator
MTARADDADGDEAPAAKEYPMTRDQDRGNQHPGRVHERARTRIVEELSVVLEDAGVPRMPARLFAFALASDQDAHTAREFADGLEVSPAAVSGAVRYLVQTGMVRRERRRGERSDVYVIDHENPWAAVTASRGPWLERGAAVLGRASEELDDSSVGRMRLARSAEFFDFLIEDVNGLTERWAAYLRTHR